jgi:hypothetical protein
VKAIKSIPDIIERTNELNDTCVWTENNELVSTNSGRVIASVAWVGDKATANIGRHYNADGTQFTTMAAAKVWTKFTAIKNILADELGEATLQ